MTLYGSDGREFRVRLAGDPVARPRRSFSMLMRSVAETLRWSTRSSRLDVATLARNVARGAAAKDFTNAARPEIYDDH